MSNTSLKSAVESILFASHRALSLRDIAKATGGEKQEIKEILKDLVQEYKKDNRGIVILKNDGKYQMATNPSNGEIVKSFLKKEVNSKMTPASLETLSIIAYRGPVGKEELEKVRGVNCSIILRNLLMKGLIVEKDKENEIYDISLDFLRRIGVSKRGELPEFEKLNGDNPLEDFVDEKKGG